MPSRVSICGCLENGYDKTLERLAWRQLKGAYNVHLILAPKDFPTLEEAIDSLEGQKVFLIPPDRIESVDLRDFQIPEGTVNYIFGRAGDNMVRYVQEGDMVVSIHTPHNADMMSVAAASIVLNKHHECRQQNSYK